MNGNNLILSTRHFKPSVTSRASKHSYKDTSHSPISSTHNIQRYPYFNFTSKYKPLFGDDPSKNENISQNSNIVKIEGIQNKIVISSDRSNISESSQEKIHRVSRIQRNTNPLTLKNRILSQKDNLKERSAERIIPVNISNLDNMVNSQRSLKNIDSQGFLK